MFSLASITICSPERNATTNRIEPAKSQYVMMGVDMLFGIALLAIGILATQFKFNFLDFLPSGMNYALLGAGATYVTGMLLFIAVVIKMLKKPDSYVC